MQQVFLRIFGLGIVLAVAVLFALAAKDIVGNWGHTVARALAIGFILGCVVYQIAHRVKYGRWYD